MNIRQVLIVGISIMMGMGRLGAQYTELSIGLGVANYFGDLNSDELLNNIKQTSWAGAVDYTYSFNRYINARLSYTMLQVKGHDKYQTVKSKQRRNLSFQSAVHEFGIIGEVYPFSFSYKRKEFPVKPYLVGGVALFYFNPKTKYNGDKIKLHQLQTESIDYNRLSYAIPLGVGFKIKLSKKVSISLEGMMRYTPTDYLDDVSFRYVGYDFLLQNHGELSANLSQRIDEYDDQVEGTYDELTVNTQRGNPDVSDYYFTAIAKLQFNLGDGLQNPLKLFRRSSSSCPEF